MTADTIGMESSAQAPQIRRNYKASSAFQWVREATINALQAGATHIEFGTEWVAVENLGVHRRTILDNGKGMSGPEMPGFLNKYGGSGKTIGDTLENFGVGLKSSALPWNEDGLAVISKQTIGELVTLYMMWLHLDPTLLVDGIPDFGAREIFNEILDLDDEDAQEWLDEHARSLGIASKYASAVIPLHECDEAIIDGVDWVKVAEPLASFDSGTLLVMLGKAGTPDTVLGDPSRDERGKYDIVEYLNTKLWEMPAAVTIQSRQYEVHGRKSQSVDVHDKSEWPTSASDPRGSRQHRNGRSLKTDIEGTYAKYGEARETITIEPSDTNPVGVILDVYLFKAAGTMTKGKYYAVRQDAAGVPLLTVKYSAHAGIYETFNTTAKDVDLDRWISVKPVRDRTVIVATPMTNGVVVFPNTSRSDLLYEDAAEGGARLPMNVWSSHFRKNPPAIIAKAIKEYYDELATNGDDGLSDDDYDRLGQRWGERVHNALRWIRSRRSTEDKGEETSDALQGQHKKRKSKRRTPRNPVNTAKPDPASKNSMRQREVGVNIIKVMPVDQAAMMSPAYALKLDQAAMVGSLNTDHTYYVTALESVLEQFDSQITDANRDAVVVAFRRAALSHAALALTAQWSLAKINPKERDELLTEAALTAALGGVRHLIQAAEQGVRDAFKGRGRKAA